MPRVGDRYSVGGLLLPRPFQVRGLGHLGLGLPRPGQFVDFYTTLLGFRVSDVVDYTARPKGRDLLENVPDPKGYFLRIGADHHSLVLFNHEVMRRLRQGEDPAATDENSFDHMALECGSLAELVASQAYFRERDVPIVRAGRYFPGSNWHILVRDPDGHTIELFCNLEQIGWNGRTKPAAMYDRLLDEPPTQPQPSEDVEVLQAMKSGIDFDNGHWSGEGTRGRWSVDGILRPRPFQVTHVGPLKLFVRDVDRSARFYGEVLGLKLTEETLVHGHRCLFLRAGTAHHALGLIPLDLKPMLLPEARTTVCSVGLRVGNYGQLRDAVAFLKQRNVRFLDWPAELSPGVGFCAHVLSPDGSCFQLYHDMEQIGWDGKPRPAPQRPRPTKGEWPEFLEPDDGR